MGQVYQATDTKLNRQVALKIRCLRRSLLIRQPFVVRTTMSASATRPRQFRRPPPTRAE